MSREKESNDYDTLLSLLTTLTADLKSGGPRVLEDIQRRMDDYLEKEFGDPNTLEWLSRGLSDSDSEPCIDFEHQKGYK